MSSKPAQDVSEPDHSEHNLSNYNQVLQRQGSELPLTHGVAPPDDYYASNLQQLVQFVSWRYAEVLDAATRGVIDAIAALAPEPSRLLARLCMRKGALFRCDALSYREVPDIETALDVLQERSLIQRQSACAADQLLQKVKLAELRTWFPATARMSKRAAVEHLLERHADAAVRAALHGKLRWFSLVCDGSMQRIQRLYFGQGRQDLSAFVLEDLGLARYPEYRLSAPDWLGTDPQSLQNHEHLYQWSGMTHELSLSPNPNALALALLQRLRNFVPSREQKRTRDRALLRLGTHLERNGELDTALEAYQAAAAHPARERRVRILCAQGREQAAQQLLQQIRVQPWCATETDFAERFGTRRKRGQSDFQQTELSLLGPTPAEIEQCAAQLLLRDGGNAWHVENQLPLGLAGLVYWDAIYADVPGAFTRPFQSGPNDLFWSDFAQVRQDPIRAIEACWHSDGAYDPLTHASDQFSSDAWSQRLRRNLQAHRETVNPLVNWRLFDVDFVDALLQQVPISALAQLAAFTVRQLDQHRTGFPDLLVTYADDSYELVEVKGPNDQLQGGQRRWLKVLARLGLPARVLKLRADRS